MGDHGLGSLRPAGEGKWRYWPPMTNGVRPPSKTIKAPTKRAAWEQAAIIRSKYAAGEYVRNDRTVADAVEVWLEHRRNLSASTRRNYEQTLRKYTLPALGKTRVDRLTLQDIEQHYYSIPQSAAKNAHQVLRQSLALVVRWGWIPRSPAADAKLPKVNARPLAPPDLATMDRLFNHYALFPDRSLFFRLAALTGCRRGELCAIRWDDIADGRLTIARSITWNAEGKPVVGERTKTGKTRTIGLGDEMAAELEQLRTERAAMLGDRLGYVFTRDDGTTPWHPITVSHWFRAAADAAGYTGRLHDLRHFHATALLAAGIPVTDVAARLGHSRSATTLNVYGHVLPGRDQEIANLAERLMRG